MRFFIEYTIGLILGFFWLAGIVLANGFWLTMTAICVPFYAWYLVVERALQLWSFV